MAAITVQRATGNYNSLNDMPRVAIVWKDYKNPPTKCRHYNLTDASLARIERIAAAKTTRRMDMEICNWIYNDYTITR